MPKLPTPKPPSGGGNRRQRLAAVEADRKAAQRRRTIGLLLVCVLLAAALLSYPVYLVVKDSQASSAALADLGVPAAEAGCDPVETNPASGNQNHVADGTKVTYDRTPPDSGPHYASPAPFTKRFYSADDRPAAETLVHNLEHGYTVAWYRDGAPESDREALAAIAKTFTAEDYDPGQKFIAAPWTEADGAGFPDGKNVVLTRWTADPANPTDTSQQKGVRQACAAVSGEAIETFMQTYPSTASPEPNGA
jgi:hypothetical protein